MILFFDPPDTLPGRRFLTYPAPSLPMEGDSYFTLAQRKYQRDIHPHQGLPLYGEDATRIIAETATILRFGIAGHAMILFVGWRGEGHGLNYLMAARILESVIP